MQSGERGGGLLFGQQSTTQHSAAGQQGTQSGERGGGGVLLGQQSTA
jgi:hypothetical protein